MKREDEQTNYKVHDNGRKMGLHWMNKGMTMDEKMDDGKDDSKKKDDIRM